MKRADIRREIERLEHEALDPRSWREWAHSASCDRCTLAMEMDLIWGEEGQSG